eukprot:628469-Pelagomonas_calceolata.AAC.1
MALSKPSHPHPMDTARLIDAKPHILHCVASVQYAACFSAYAAAHSSDKVQLQVTHHAPCNDYMLHRTPHSMLSYCIP